MCASVGAESRVVKVTMPTVEICELNEEVPAKVQPPVPEPNVVATATLPPVPVTPPPVPPSPDEPLCPPLVPQPSPTQQSTPHQSRAVEPLFIW